MKKQKVEKNKKCGNPQKKADPRKGICLHIHNIGQDSKKFKIVNIFYPSFLTFVLCAQKNLPKATVLLNTHNICFD